jgi:hypothetical protein
MAPTNQLPLCVRRSIVHTSLDLRIRCSVLVVVLCQGAIDTAPAPRCLPPSPSADVDARANHAELADPRSAAVSGTRSGRSHPGSPRKGRPLAHASRRS